MSHATFTERVANYFKAHPNEWVSAYTLMELGGSLAFRTRISNCRRKYGMLIENKVERDERHVAHSFYMFVPTDAQKAQAA